MQVRRANMKDMIEMQNCNLRCLPENYNLRYYYYHYLSWPQHLYVLEDVSGSIAGYVLAKLDDEDDAKKKHGHITSLATLRTHRKLGAAGHVMRNSMREMVEVDDANYCSLHVRKTNVAALHLYQDTLNFRCVGVEKKYYLDDEDAYHMKRLFKIQEEKGAMEGKISYCTPHGDLKWVKLDEDQIEKMNSRDNVMTYTNNEKAKKKIEQEKKSGGDGDDSSANVAAAASSGGKNEKKESGGESKAKKKNKGGAEKIDIEAQLAALREPGEGGGGGGKKEKSGGGKKKK